MRRRQSDSAPPSHGEMYPTVAVGTLVIIAPHLLGGAPAWATLTLAALSVAVLAMVSLSARPRDSALASASVLLKEPMTLVLAAALVLTVLHALPWPAFLARAVGLDAYDHAAQTAQGFQLSPPKWVAFSLDAPGTYERILYGIAVFASFMAARLCAYSPRGSSSVLRMLAVSAILVGISHAGHTLFGAERVYGVYQPLQARPLGPLLNPNSLAGFMALALPICLGLGLRQGPKPRWPWFVGAAIVAATALLSRSRGGLGALVASCLLFGYFRWLSLRRTQAPSRRDGYRAPMRKTRPWEAAVLGALVLGIGFALAAVAADDFVDTDYEDVSKFTLFRAEWEALRANPMVALVGAGRGAFSAFFAGHYGPWRAYHAENLFLQHAIEYGIPVTLLMLGVGLWSLGTALLQVRSPAKLGGLVGVTALGLQNMLDLGLELTGIAIPAAVCLAISLPAGAAERATKAETGRFQANDVGLISAVAVAVLIALVGRRALAFDPVPLLAQLNGQLKSNSAAAEFRARLEPAAMAHPADPAFAMLAASHAVLHRTSGAAFWLNRTMMLAPRWGAPHLWAARWLESHGRVEQAHVELSLAAELDVVGTARGLCEWVDQRPIAATVLSTAPSTEPARTHILDTGAHCLWAKPDEAAKVDRLLLKSNGTHMAANLRSMRRELASRDYAAVLRRAAILHSASPRLAEPYRLHADALSALGRGDQAVRVLADAATRTDERSSILTALAVAQTRNNDAEGMRNTIDQLRMAASGRVTALAAAAALLGHCETQLGNHARALKAMREAHALQPTAQYLASAAQLAKKLGQIEFALSAWRQLCSSDPQKREYCKERDALVEAALR
jgi:tetratricopeptide (TPR) repeat protein